MDLRNIFSITIDEGVKLNYKDKPNVPNSFVTENLENDKRILFSCKPYRGVVR